MRWLPVDRKLAAVVRELVEVAAHGLRDVMWLHVNPPGFS